MSDPRYKQWGFTKKLAKVVEECGEVLAAAGKLQRYGRMAVNDLLPPIEQETNIDWLMRELNDLHEAIHDLQNAVKKGQFDDEPIYPTQFERDRISWSNPGEEFKIGGTD